MDTNAYYCTGKVKTISYDGVYSSVIYDSGDWRTPLCDSKADTPGKNRFKKLIKRASQPVPKEQDKQLHPEGYSEKQTRSRNTADTSAKRSGKSHQ